jgi:integrase
MTGVKWQKTRRPGIYKREGPHGTHYRVVYRDSTSKQFSRNFSRQKDAEDFQSSMRLDRPRDLRSGRKTLQALYEEVHARRPYAAATVALHGEVWKKIEGLAAKEVRNIDSGHIEGVLGAIDKPAMREKTRALLSMLFACAIERRYISASPVPRRARSRTRAERMREHRTSAKDRKRYLTPDELQRFLKELPERYRGLVELMCWMGLRPGEAYALKVGKFDPMRRTLTVDDSVTGFTKTGEPRTLILPKVVAELLIEHIAVFSDPTDPDALVFPTEGGQMIDPGNFRKRLFYPARARAGIEDGLSPNHCRHTAASFAIGAGADVYAVQQMMGHAKPSITLDVYGELWPGSQERLAEALDESIRQVRETPKDSRQGKVVVPLASSTGS